MKFVSFLNLTALAAFALLPVASHAVITNGDFATDLNSWTSTPANGTTWVRDPNAPAPGSGFARIKQGANFKPTDPFSCGEPSTTERCTVTFRYRTMNNGDNPNPLRVTGSNSTDQRFGASAGWTTASVTLGFCGPDKRIQFASIKGQVDIDDVVDSCVAVPEPGSMLAVGAGVASLLAARRRAKK